MSHHAYPNLSSDAIRVLRDVNLLHDCGEIDGVPFIRCGRNVADGFALAASIQEATGLTSRDVTCANHPDYGDYIRVARDTGLYRFICALKS